MKKLKSLSLLLLVFTLVVNLVPINVFASPCCYLEIKSVTQGDDGVVTVNYMALNPLPNREVRVEIKTAESSNMIPVYEDKFYISADGTNASDAPYTFDGTFLLENYKYEITLSYTYCCENYYCSSESDTMEFTVQNGIPVFDYVDIPDGIFNLVGKNTAAVKLTASAAGMYDFSIKDRWDYDLKRYPGGYYYNPQVSYFSENEELIILISTRDGRDLSAKLDFGIAKITDVSSKTDNPVNNSVCFELSKNIGLNKITISKMGLYSFELADKYGYNQIELLSEKGERMGIGSIEHQLKEVLNVGVYYVDTSELNNDYSLKIKYIVPEELKLNHTYVPECSDQRVTNYYLLKVDKPSVLTIHNLSQINCGIYVGGHINYYYGEENEVLDKGEYFVKFTNDSEEGAEIKFTSTPFESISLNTPYTPTINQNGYYYYFAFCAPEDGKYEFDFSKYNRYYWFNLDYEDRTNLSYYTREMKKDEWLLVGMDQPVEISVSNYKAPEIETLEFEERAKYIYASGRENIYKFVPENDGLYRVYGENAYAKNIKIWTDAEVLYENKENYSYALNQVVNLKKGVTIYISFSGPAHSSGEESSIIIKSPYSEISNNASITVDNDAEVMVYYTATESGYHNFNFSRNYGSSVYATFVIKDNQYSVGYYNDTDVLLYLNEGEKLYITFNKFNDNWLPNINISISMIDVSDISLDTSYTPSDKTYFSFTPENNGVYKVTFPKDFRVNVKSDKSDYLATGEGNELYFVGKSGGKYLIYTYINNWGLSDNVTDYPDLRVTKVETTDINTNSSYLFTDDFEIFTFNVPETGLYRIENDLCNTRLDLFFDEKWSMISGVYSSLFRLEKGFNCIIASRKRTSADSMGSGHEGIDKPYAKFSINNAKDTKKTGISIVDGFISPNGETPYLRFCVTSPYDVLDLSIGIEYTDKAGETVKIPVGYEAMYGSDMRYVELDIFDADWETGDTVTIKPYVYVGDNSSELIYGDEKTITFNMRDDIIPLEYGTTKTKLKVQDDYNYAYKQYWFEFTQPENAESRTYITHSDALENPGLRNEDFEYVGSSYDDEGNEYYELEAGKKYYIRFTVYYDDSDAEINISSLPDVPTDTLNIISDVEVTDGVLSFVVSENTVEQDKLYVAAYDENGLLLKITTIDNPEGAYSLNINNSDKTAKYKLMLIDELLAPICKSVELSVK